jgi:hypothetical protein
VPRVLVIRCQVLILALQRLQVLLQVQDAFLKTADRGFWVFRARNDTRISVHVDNLRCVLVCFSEAASLLRWLPSQLWRLAQIRLIVLFVRSRAVVLDRCSVVDVALFPLVLVSQSAHIRLVVNCAALPRLLVARRLLFRCDIRALAALNSLRHGQSCCSCLNSLSSLQRVCPVAHYDRLFGWLSALSGHRLAVC